MRFFLSCIFIVALLDPLFCQKSLKTLISDLETTDQFSRISIPLKVFRNGIRLGLQKGEIESNINQLAAGIQKANLYSTEIEDMEEQKITSILSGHKKRLIQKDLFKEWFSYKEKDESVSLLVLEDELTITKIVLINQYKFSVRIFEFSTNISKSEFEKLVWRKELKRI